MTALQLGLALLITVGPAWIWLHRLVPVNTTGRCMLIAGYGSVLGLLATTLVMRMLSLAGIPFSLYSIGAVALMLALSGWFAPARWHSADTPGQPQQQSMTRLHTLFIALCLALLAGRLIMLGLEVGTRPVTSWDAKQHWTRQAKVFFELRSVAPYVSLQDWLDLGGQGVYTNMHPDYPIATPLIQAWTAVAIGQWNESLVNLPWLLIWVAMGLVFYSQARLAGAGAALAVGATYLLLSMPYLNIHVALAGYADLLMAACYLAAVAAFYNWSQLRQTWLLIIALACASGCLLIKNEGFYWFLTLLPGILLVLAGLRRGLLILAALALALLLVLWLLPADTVVAGHSLAAADIHYRPESWLPIYLSFMVHDNWHFLAYLVLVALVAAPFFWRTTTALAAVILSALLLYLLLYLFTSNAVGAVRFTSLNRVALQLMPAVGFFTLVVFLCWVRRQELGQTQNP